MSASLFEVKRPAAVIAVIAFFVALASGFFIQFIVLPVILPGLHAGDGLLLDSDSSGFHRLAVSLVAQMHFEGWSAWELRPRGQAPAGIAAVLYYLFVPSPYVLLPLNAALFSLSAVLIYSMVRQLFADASPAFWVSLVFIATPSSAMWYSQIHKEMLFVPAILLQIWVWLFVVRERAGPEARANAYRGLGVAVLAAILSSVLIWMVRPYFLSIMALSNVLVAVYAGVAFRRVAPDRRSMVLVMAVILILMPVVVKQLGHLSGVSSSSAQFMRENSLAGRPRLPGETVLDSFVETLNISRDGFGPLAGGSDLFAEVRFESIGDVAAFAPTALTVSLLAPFPNAWFANARQPGGQLMRTVSAFEMLFGYCGLGFLFVCVIRGGVRGRLIGMVVAFSFVPMLIWGLAIPNVGTIYRFRAPFWMLLVLFGWAFAVHQLKIWRLRNVG